MIITVIQLSIELNYHYVSLLFICLWQQCNCSAISKLTGNCLRINSVSRLYKPINKYVSFLNTHNCFLLSRCLNFSGQLARQRDCFKQGFALELLILPVDCRQRNVPARQTIHLNRILKLSHSLVRGCDPRRIHLNLLDWLL